MLGGSEEGADDGGTRLARNLVGVTGHMLVPVILLRLDRLLNVANAASSDTNDYPVEGAKKNR